MENRAGSGGNIGAEFVIRSPADGYTLLMSTASMAVNVSLYPKLPFDVRRDLIAIVQVASAPIVLPDIPTLDSMYPGFEIDKYEKIVKMSGAKPDS